MKVLINKNKKIHFLPSRINTSHIATDLLLAAVQFIRQAKLAITIDHVPTKKTNINNALAVISELSLSLDHGLGNRDAIIDIVKMIHLTVREITEGYKNNDINPLNMADSLLVDISKKITAIHEEKINTTESIECAFSAINNLEAAI